MRLRRSATLLPTLFENRVELLYNKEKLLANGDRWEHEIAHNLAARALNPLHDPIGLKTTQRLADGEAADREALAEFRFA